MSHARDSHDIHWPGAAQVCTAAVLSSVLCSVFFLFDLLVLATLQHCEYDVFSLGHCSLFRSLRGHSAKRHGCCSAGLVALFLEERERERESIELGHDGLPTYPARVADALLVRCPDVSARIADISIVSLSARRAW